MNKWCGSCHNEFELPEEAFHCPLEGCNGVLYSPGDYFYQRGISGIVVKGNFINSKLEEFATPLWKIAGFKPNADEMAAEKLRKARNMSHLDLQKERLAQSPNKFDSSSLKKDLYARKLKNKEVKRYQRRSK